MSQTRGTLQGSVLEWAGGCAAPGSPHRQSADFEGTCQRTGAPEGGVEQDTGSLQTLKRFEETCQRTGAPGEGVGQGTAACHSCWHWHVLQPTQDRPGLK